MDKNIKVVLTGIVILVVAALAISCYLANAKVKQSANEIVALNDLIKEKDIEINKLIGERDSRLQELDILKKELENVKTDLSNTVLKLQVQAPTLPPAPVKAPVKK